MGTCHKCAAPLGRGTQRHTECPKCNLMYHTTDCGQRFAAVTDSKASLEDCPKVSRQSDPPALVFRSPGGSDRTLFSFQLAGRQDIGAVVFIDASFLTNPLAAAPPCSATSCVFALAARCFVTRVVFDSDERRQLPHPSSHPG